MKLMQTFDCQDMPAAVKEAFFNNVYASNDTYVLWYTSPDGLDINGEALSYDDAFTKAWLESQVEHLEDEVLIRVGW